MNRKYKKNYTPRENIEKISIAEWSKYIEEQFDELLELSLSSIEDFVYKLDFSKADISLYDKNKDKSLENYMLTNLKQTIRHMDDSLKLAHLSKIHSGGRGIYSSCLYYVCKKYNISMANGRMKRYERTFKPAFQMLHGAIRYESQKIWEDAINRNDSFLKLKSIFREEEIRRKNMILHEIPASMPLMYPAARELKRHFIFHVGPTNSGKTYDALQALKNAENGIYLAPLRLLAYEIYDRLNGEGVPCDMITGEEEIIVPGAKHSSATIETLSTAEEYEVGVIDECQLIGDRQRGGAWTKALLGLCAEEIHVCSDESAVELAIKIIEECGDTYEIVRHERSTELVCDKKQSFIFPESVEERDALIVFSKANCIAVSAELQDAGIPASMIYGSLPYDVRMSEVKRFISGETKVVVATDAIGMGLNLPIRRIVFLETKKFDGEDVRNLSVSEIKQIAGRAGRRGIYEQGLYTAEFHRSMIEKAVKDSLPPVIKARIGLPETIIYIDLPLSEIMIRWSEILTEDIYEKADIQEDIKLCTLLEQVIEDKLVLYNFIMIGFRTGKQFLTDIILECAKIEVNTTDDKDTLIDELIDTHSVLYDEELSYMTMEELEDLYLKYDLIYAYLRKFRHVKRLNAIMQLKKSCSEKIIDILKNQKLESRRCRKCKTPLPWNYPFGICGRCYGRR